MSGPRDADNDSIEIQDPAGESFRVPASLPLLPVRDVIIFPGVTVPLTVGRVMSIACLGIGTLLFLGIGALLFTLRELLPSQTEK